MAPSTSCMLTLCPVSRADIDDLRTFEFDCRAYFESQVNARPDAYYAPGGLERAVDDAIDDAGHQKSFQYLARDNQGTLVARVNFHHVRCSQFQSAELGYRVSPAMSGRGVASEAVRLALPLAFETHGLRRVEAAVRVDHVASLKVLERHAFTVYGQSHRSFELGGVWHDRLHLELHVDTWAAST